MSSRENTETILEILEKRFNENKNRHESLHWKNIQEKLVANSAKLKILTQMEETGGEPDVVDFNENSGEYLFVDCSVESPKERRSFCYDKNALDKRKENKPKNNALDAAKAIGIEILNEKEYRHLQTLGNFDNRKLGGAIFGDFRYGTVFIYHNGADSYYAARGFRGKLSV